MTLTEPEEWPGGAPAFELDLEVLELISGAEFRVFADSYCVQDGSIEFSIGVENLGDGPLHLYAIATVPLEVVAHFREWPVFHAEPEVAEAGIATPHPPLGAPLPGIRLFSVRLAEMRGRRGEARIRAHGYRVADNTAWFYLDVPQPGEVFDIASLSLDLLAGPPSEAVTEVSGPPCPHCGAPMTPILYGRPSREALARAERGEIVLGGCVIGPDAPRWSCPSEGQAR
ncbi:hypothetical protein [Nocardia sp. NPDC057353]|uniref:hypothetical protein n=1 Tax=Nocardia sp. NPDC057353 TaxID=3346104 RepID=UPI00362B9EE0